MRLCQLAMPSFRAVNKPLTVRITYSELSGESAMDFMLEGMSNSPLQDAGMPSDTQEEIKGLCREVVEEPTARGFRVKYRFC